MSIRKCSVCMPAIGTKAYQMVDGKVCAVKLLNWRVKCMYDDGLFGPFHDGKYTKYLITSEWLVAGRAENLIIQEDTFAYTLYMLHKPVYSTPEAFASVRGKDKTRVDGQQVDLMDMFIEQCPQCFKEFTIRRCYVRDGMVSGHDAYTFSRWYWDGGMAREAEMTFNEILCDKDGLHLLGMHFCRVSYEAVTTYATKEECEAQNTMQVVEFEDEEPDEEDFAEQKREEFRDYVAHHCPGFEDKIDWEYFMNLKSMPENLAMQVENWTRV